MASHLEFVAYIAEQTGDAQGEKEIKQMLTGTGGSVAWCSYEKGPGFPGPFVVRLAKA